MTRQANPPTDPVSLAACGREAWAGRVFRWLAGGVILAAGLIAYHNSLSGPFVYDDPASILRNATIHGLHWRTIGRVFCTPGGASPLQSRPIANLTLAINYALGGDRVWGYHAFNLAIHLAAGLILFGVARRTFRLPRMPQSIRSAADLLGFATALVWIVHPLGSEAVAYITERTESLMAMFYLLTLYGLVVGATAGSRIGRSAGFGVSVAACALGMGCKEIIISAPFLAVVYDCVFITGSWRETWRRRWKLYLALAATWGALAGAIALSGTRYNTSILERHATVWEYACTQFGAIVTYLKLSVWPSPLIVDYGENKPLALGEILPPAVVVALLLGLTIWALARRPAALKMVGFIGAWVFVILAPTSSVLPLATEPIAERRMYLPLAGLVAGAVALGYWFGQRAFARMGVGRWGRRAIGLGLLAAVVVPFAWLTVRRNRDYQSEFALWQDTVNKRPGNPRALNNLGLVFGEQFGDQDRAIALYGEAITIAPWYAKPYINRASAYGRKGDFGRAIADCNKAIELDPSSAAAYCARGGAYGDQRDFSRAVADLTRAIELDPQFAPAYNNLGNFYVRTDDISLAIANYSKAVELDPRFAQAYNNRGSAYGEQGDQDRAIADFTRAIDLNPSYAEALYNRGLAHGDKGEQGNAIADYTRAIELAPRNARAYASRGLAYAEKDDYDRAIADLNQAVELAPNDAEAYRSRAAAFLFKKEYDKAWADVRKCRSLGGTVEPKLLELLRAASGRSE